MERLIDTAEIWDVLVQYCRGIDRNDLGLVRSAYHDDAIEHHAAFDGRTPDDLIVYVEARNDAFTAVAHYITNHAVEFDGDIAYSEAYVIAVHRGTADDPTYEVVVGGRYIDRFERRAGRWAIADRAVVLDWSRTGNSPAWERSGLFVAGGKRPHDPSYLRLPRGAGSDNRPDLTEGPV